MIGFFCRENRTMNNVINTSNGKFAGINENGYISYKGIPFAKAPQGKLRYLPPQDPEPFAGIRLCDHFGNSAPQNIQPAGNIKAEECSEDCLYLNVYTPENADGCPVLFHIHGGAFQFGNHDMFPDVSKLTSRGIVVVTANYRLSVFGFLQLDDILGPEYIQSGNAGFLDIVKALEWTKMNIASFGGDPDKITVMGESAGAKMAGSLLVSKQAKGLFSQVFMESGAVQCIRDLHTARTIASRFTDHFEMTKEELKEYLLTAPWQELISHMNQAFGRPGLHDFGPVFDGIAFDGEDALAIIQRGDAADAVIMAGYNRDEFSTPYHMTPKFTREVFAKFFGLNTDYVMEKLGDCWQDPQDEGKELIWKMSRYLYGYPTLQMLETYRTSGYKGKMYLYRNDWDKDPMGAFHTLGAQIMMGYYSMLHPEVKEDPEYTRLEKDMYAYWLNFLLHRDPNGEGLAYWPSYEDDRKAMYFGVQERADSAERHDEGMPGQILML